MTDHDTSSHGAPDAGPLLGTELTASLTVADLERSLAWYRDALGFEEAQRYERDGTLMAVSLRAGAVRILLTRDDGARGTDRVKGAGFSLQITTQQDIDAIAGRVKAHGSELATEPETARWGQRVFRVRDPDGFLWVVSSPRL